MINSALEYVEKYGFSIIPMKYLPPQNGEAKGKKVPRLTEWRRYQKEKPSVEQVKLWWESWPDAMIGVITGKLSGVCSIDVDEEIGFEEIQKYIPDSLIMPTYNTPSGGVQMLFRMPEFNLRNATRNLPGCDLRAEGGIALLPPSSNVVGKYQWVDGLDLANINPPEVPEQYIAYEKKRKNIYNKGDETHANNGDSNNELQQSQGITLSLDEGSRNDSLFSVALSLAKGNMTKDNALYVLRNVNVNPPLPERELLTILDSAYSRHFGRERNIAAEIEAWSRVTTGNFHVTTSYNELQIVTKEHKAAARMAYHRFSKPDGFLEKVGNKDGIYCVKKSTIEDMDFMNADTTPFDVEWPLGVHKLVEVYQKSIVIIAGESNAGKTAYCLNIAKLNRDKHDVLYFLSEGDAAELKIRLSKFNEPLQKWQKVKFKGIRGGKLSKIINPDGFNIIDYLELHKDFFEVSGVIDEIYQALNTGIAVIALQKPQGRDLGIGGRGTLDKARLYLAIEPGKIKIVKGKIWARPDQNPNGKFCTWTLGGGCNFKRVKEGEVWEQDIVTRAPSTTRDRST